MRRIILFVFALIYLSGCSKEYKIGKILIVNEAKTELNANISDMAEELIKHSKNLTTTGPEKSNSTLKITISDSDFRPNRESQGDRLGVTLTLTATLKDKGVQIIQSEGISDKDTKQIKAEESLKSALINAIQRLDYQCTIKKYTEDELIKKFDSPRLSKWEKETILSELGERVNTATAKDYKKLFDFLYKKCFLSNPKEFGDKIIGILSSADISKFGLTEEEKDSIATRIARYSLSREPYIQIHTISILGKIGSQVAQSILFTLSTGSTNRSVREHAKEVLSELEKKSSNPDHIVISK